MQRTTLAISPGKATALAFTFMLSFLAIMSAGMVGSVGAAGDTTELANDTLDVDNQTRSVFAEVDAADQNVTVNVSFYGVDSGGNETLVSEQTDQTVTANNSEMFEETANASAYEEYRVQVQAQSNSTNATASTGTIQKVSSGGGGLLGGSGSPGMTGIAAFVVVAGALYLSRGS